MLPVAKTGKQIFQLCVNSIVHTPTAAQSPGSTARTASWCRWRADCVKTEAEDLRLRVRESMNPSFVQRVQYQDKVLTSSLSRISSMKHMFVCAGYLALLGCACGFLIDWRVAHVNLMFHERLLDCWSWRGFSSLHRKCKTSSYAARKQASVLISCTRFSLVVVRHNTEIFPRKCKMSPRPPLHPPTALDSLVNQGITVKRHVWCRWQGIQPPPSEKAVFARNVSKNGTMGIIWDIMQPMQPENPAHIDLGSL